MYSGEGPLDDANDHDPPERKRRFKSAAKSGAHCGDDQAGHCGRPLKPDEPVWLIRRRYTRDHYDSDDVVAPICWKCWEDGEQSDCEEQSRSIATQGPWTGWGRLVHVTPQALDLWLARGRRICCSDKCAEMTDTRPCAGCGKPFSPKRADAQCCSPACKQAAHRRKKVSQDNQ